MVEFSDDIDEEIWIDHSLPLAFDYFSIDDDFLEYLGAHFELPKSNEKHQASYMLNEYAYFHKEVNFYDVLQVQTLDANEITPPTMEDLPTLIQKKNDLTFPQEELFSINIAIMDGERLLQIEATLSISQQERYKSKFIEYYENFTWSYDDMLGLDPPFIMHNLFLKEDAKPIKQKLRKMHPSNSLLVKKEIKKILTSMIHIVH